MADDPSPTAGYSAATLEHLRPRAYRSDTHVIVEACEGHDYRIAIARLTSHRQILRVVRWLAWRPGVTPAALDAFIRVAGHAAGMPVDAD